MKKTIALFLVFALAVGMMPFSVLAVDLASAEKNEVSSDVLTDEKREGKEGVLYYWVFPDKGYATIEDCDPSASGAISIPAFIEGYPVTQIGMHAFSECNSITSVSVPNSVTVIGSYAFSDCKLLKSVTLPFGVTEIGFSAFSGSAALTTVNLPSTLKSIGDSAFWNCASLKSVTIPAGVKTLEHGVFYGCAALTSIVIPETVTSIGKNAFQGCTSLATVDLPDAFRNVGANAFADTAIVNAQPDGAVYVEHVAVGVKGALPKTVLVKKGTTVLADEFMHLADKAETLVLPGTLTYVGTKAVLDSDVTLVCYEGSENEAKKITFASENDDFKALTWQYNYCYTTLGEHSFESETDEDCNDCGYVRQLFTPGDLDENGAVNSADAIYLLYHTLFGSDRYPVNQPVDYDDDGSVSSADAIYLLYHTLFGSGRYPL